jgi:hypothetical protein
MEKNFTTAESTEHMNKASEFEQAELTQQLARGR